MKRNLFIKQVSGILLRRRAALWQSLSTELSGFQISDSTCVGDRLDFALEAEYAEINSGLAEAEFRELKEVERALEHLRDGSYGNCECCGQRIRLERLTALPHATVCHSCTKIWEDSSPDYDSSHRDLVL